ncbi:haloacid dehalogenase type II [Hymenobacter sp. YC55]|uniref:haloacid dehalogenase type II n=1 Tax=Hymenobacter sp. YC55 TaxID=3034019 RepID=UPI0023F758B7|nr:haloacid dehalogenase type II [Hymenobacter sp. YC55]MDF7812592.1 haloacid dehalogenase type II [Hymenobacter sp. YC55]
MQTLLTTSSPQPKVIFFDVNETLLDMSKLKRAVGKAFGNKFAFQQWFGLLLQYSLVDTVTGSYHPFSVIAEAALDMAADKLEEKHLKPAKKREIVQLLTELPAHKDVPKGLAMLLDMGIRLVAFTNSTREVLDEQLRYAGIIHYFEQGLSIDIGQRYKPHLDTYLAAVQTAGVQPAEAALIAAHGWDVAGALQAGLAAGFIARPGQELYPLAPAPTYQGKTLVEVAKQIAKATPSV